MNIPTTYADLVKLSDYADLAKHLDALSERFPVTRWQLAQAAEAAESAHRHQQRIVKQARAVAEQFRQITGE